MSLSQSGPVVFNGTAAVNFYKRCFTLCDLGAVKGEGREKEHLIQDQRQSRQETTLRVA
jgi:hypothetical protein